MSIIYDVVVGNIGHIAPANCTKKEALRLFQEYKRQSKSGYGRAAGESVYYFENGELVKEYVGKLDQSETT